MALKVKNLINTEVWKEWKYNVWASDEGRVKKVYKNGSERLLGCKKTTGNKDAVIHIKAGQIRIKDIVWETFKGKKPEGMSISHRNGLKYDNSIYNLYPISKHDLGKKTGHLARSHKVYDAKTKKVYRSTRECAKAIFSNYQTVADCCNGKHNPFTVDCYWYDDENDVIFRGNYNEHESRYKSL